MIGSDKVEGTAVYGADDKQIGSIERVMIDKRCGPALRQYALPDTFGPSFKVSPYFRLTSACAPFFGPPFGQIGRAWRESDYDATDLETVIQYLLSGEYSYPRSRLHTAERWSEAYQRTLPKNCDGAATSKCASLLQRYRSTGSPAIDSAAGLMRRVLDLEGVA